MLFALLSEARKLSNAELQALIGIRLEGKERRKLNELKLVESEKVGPAFAHELSDAGWRWCTDQLSAGPDGHRTGLERAHYLLFGVFARHLDAAGLSLADLICASPAPAPAGRHVRRDAAAGGGDLTARVTSTYHSLTPAPGAFVRLSELRDRLADVPTPALDATLTTLFVAGRINLIPQSNQQALTAEDRESALRVGGEHKHLISIE